VSPKLLLSMGLANRDCQTRSQIQTWREHVRRPPLSNTTTFIQRRLPLPTSAEQQSLGTLPYAIDETSLPARSARMFRVRQIRPHQHVCTNTQFGCCDCSNTERSHRHPITHPDCNAHARLCQARPNPLATRQTTNGETSIWVQSGSYATSSQPRGSRTSTKSWNTRYRCWPCTRH